MMNKHVIVAKWEGKTPPMPDSIDIWECMECKKVFDNRAAAYAHRAEYDTPEERMQTCLARGLHIPQPAAWENFPFAEEGSISIPTHFPDHTRVTHMYCPNCGHMSQVAWS